MGCCFRPLDQLIGRGPVARMCKASTKELGRAPSSTFPQSAFESSCERASERSTWYNRQTRDRSSRPETRGEKSQAAHSSSESGFSQTRRPAETKRHETNRIRQAIGATAGNDKLQAHLVFEFEPRAEFAFRRKRARQATPTPLPTSVCAAGGCGRRALRQRRKV